MRFVGALVRSASRASSRRSSRRSDRNGIANPQRSRRSAHHDISLADQKSRTPAKKIAAIVRLSNIPNTRIEARFRHRTRPTSYRDGNDYCARFRLEILIRIASMHPQENRKCRNCRSLKVQRFANDSDLITATVCGNRRDSIRVATEGTVREPAATRCVAAQSVGPREPLPSSNCNERGARHD